jgi:DtxR family Mn-dependent transcriptional regulator
MTTPNVENYLKSIYHLQNQKNDRVKTQDLAEALDLTPSSVTNMLKSLSDDEFVDYEPYKGVTLTESGVETALKVIRNHRLVEMFLVDTLDFDWDEVHEEAEQLEHAVSDKVAKQIDEYLGHPRVDPHGDPIPTADGDVHQSDAQPLDEVETGSVVRIERVLDQDPEVLQHFENIGLTPNTVVDIVDVRSVDGQMTLQLDGEETTLNRELAKKLLVTDED